METFYKKHLYFEQRTQSKEYQLDKCMKVLELIARVKDRNQNIREFCENCFGTNSTGNIITTQAELDKYNFNLEVIKRLQKYYNNLIQNLKRF